MRFLTIKLPDKVPKKRRQKAHPDITSHWIEIRDAETDMLLEKKLQPENIFEFDNPGSLFWHFMKHNDSVVYMARLTATEPPEYGSFFVQGLRVSQQLNGRFKDICTDKYYRSFQKCMDTLAESLEMKIQKADAARTSQVNTMIEALGEGSLVRKLIDPFKKMSCAYNMNHLAAILKTADIRTNNEILHYLEKYVEAVVHMGNIHEDKYRLLSENLQSIPVYLRKDFFRLVTTRYGDEQISYDAYTQDIAHNLLHLDEDKAKIYVSFLDKMAFENCDQCIIELKCWVGVGNLNEGDMAILTPVQQDTYYSVLRLVLKDWFDDPRELAEETVALSEAIGKGQALSTALDVIRANDIGFMNELRQSYGQGHDAYRTIWELNHANDP